MCYLNNIQSLVTSESIHLFWEKPERLAGEHHFKIFLNHKQVGETNKTHYQLEKLRPETVYCIQIEVYAINEEKIFKIGDSKESVISTGAHKNKINITKEPYMALGDGNTLNTAALQKAIDDCGKDDMVYIPKGVFLTGALRLHSNMELYLDEDAILQGTSKVEDYLPKIKSRFEGLEMECFSSLLNMGELDHKSEPNCENIIIRGKGTIASGGRTLAEKVIVSERKRLAAYIQKLGDSIQDYENENTIPGRARPRLINISNSRNVWISGLTLKNGASWNVHMIYSDQIITEDCTFHSENVWNGDGWDPDSSTNCTIYNCKFYTGDDSVAIKAGKNPEGNIINRPCEHIRIFDCTSAYGHGIAIGSEMSGGVNDVRIWDCDLSKSLYGIEIKGTKKRGGYVKNVHVRDCDVSRILFHSVGYNDDGEGAAEPPIFESCSFNNIYIRGEFLDKEGRKNPCKPIELCGFDVPGYSIKDITFNNIVIGNKTDDNEISIKYCENVTLKHIDC